MLLDEANEGNECYWKKLLFLDSGEEIEFKNKENI